MKASMFCICLLLFLTCLSPASLQAGNIYGNLWQDGKPLPNAQITITCSSGHSAKTEADGSYRVFVQERGRCTFLVQFGSQSAQAEIASYDNAIKYDFDVVRQGGGFILRRR